MKKLLSIVVLLLVAGATICSGQNETLVKGRIIEKKSGESVGFATVAIIKQDSIIVAGTMATEDGCFELRAANGHVTVVASLVGYKDARMEIYVSGQITDAGVIEMEEDNLTIEASLVQAQLPHTELKGDAVVTNIAGTVLEHAGNAEDILGKIPGMLRRDGKLEVIGRGEPVYYINGRRVLDTDELRSLLAEEIRSIDVVNNPGASYSGDIKSVVRIRTVRRQGEGFSYALTSQAQKYLTTKEFDPSWTVLDLNYRKNSLDFIGKITYWNNHSFQYADIYETSYTPGKFYEQNGDAEFVRTASGMNTLFGMNWQINENHSMGFQVQNNSNLSGQATYCVEESVLMNGNQIDYLKSEGYTELLNGNGWNGNMYYTGRIGDLEIEFNTDFQNDTESDSDNITESSQIEPRIIKSDIDKVSNIIASKLIFKYPVWKGQFQVGTEETYVGAWQKHKIDFEEIPSSEAEIKENTIAGFAEYAFSLKSSQFSAGVRYEHVDFVYDDIAGTSDLDRKQNNWFPSASFSTRIGEVSLSASISGKTQRPSFWQLSNEMQYHSRFTYQTGDPTLKNEKYIDAAIKANWKWLTFSSTYDNIKDAIETLGMPYNDEGVVILKYANLDTPINVYSAYIVAAPTVGCWSPQYTIGVRKQFLDLNVEDIREASGIRTVHYNTPMYTLQLNNAFRLKHSWQLSADYQFRSRMSYGAAELTTTLNVLDFSIQKSFLKNDDLTVRLSASDVLNGSKEMAIVEFGQYYISQLNDHKRPAITLRISYHFNNAINRYKGTGAGESVKNRL